MFGLQLPEFQDEDLEGKHLERLGKLAWMYSIWRAFEAMALAMGDFHLFVKCASVLSHLEEGKKGKRRTSQICFKFPIFNLNFLEKKSLLF